MKQFHFRLGSVLLLRQRHLNEAEERYARAIQARHRVEQQLVQGNERLEAMNQVVLDTRSARVNPGLQEGYVSSLKLAKQRLTQIEEDLQKARAQEAREREKYVEAHRSFELLSRLKEQQYRKHWHEEFQKEQHLMDDLYNSRKAAMQSVKKV